MKSKITRRTALAGISAFATVGAMASTPVSASQMTALIEQHRRLEAEAKELNDRYEHLDAECNIPFPKVQISRDHFTKEPYFTNSEHEIRDWGRKCAFWPGSEAKAEEWIARKLALLEIEWQRFRDAREAAGLTALAEQCDRADDAEYQAFKALVSAKPVTLAEIEERTRYLLAMMEGEDDPAKHKITYFLDYLFASFLSEEA